MTGLTDDTTGLPLPWEQQPRETARAYGAFIVYRDLPPEQRSASRVASEYGRTKRLIERWRSDWFWVDRCRAHDAQMDKLKRKAMVEARVRMGDRQAVHAEMLQRAMIAPVQALLVKLADLIDKEELPRLTVPQLIALSVMTGRVWPVAARAEREARGAPIPEWQEREVGEVDEPTIVLDDEDELAEVWAALEAAGLAPRPIDAPASTNGHVELGPGEET